jgi:hypothetical protein
MTQAASALLVGDAELDRVEILLRRFGVDFERVRAPRPTLQFPTPRRLLVVSGPCVPRLPALLPGEPGEEPPLRICIHSQDFLPLRERLRELGFHYLVQTALDETSLRMFFEQVLYTGARQRSSVRLPLGGSIEYRAPSSSGTAKLVDVSADGCRIAGARKLRLDEPATVLLPATLGGGAPLVLHGHVMRWTPAAGEGRQAESSAVIRFGALDAAAREQIERLVQGKQPGTKVTPLAPTAAAPAVTAPSAPAARSGKDRRREERHAYRGRVEVLELPGGADGALGRDLSLAGVRITSGHRLRVDAKLTLALYGGRGGDPVVVEAEVVRVDGVEAALAFGRLTGAQQERIAALIAQEPPLASLEVSADPTGRVVAAQILRRNS